jgi:anti-anti-sigma factor
MFASVGVIVDWDENRGVLQCTGDEDRSTQSRRRRALSRAILAREDVTVDLSDLGFADTSLMLDLAALARRLRRVGRALFLRCPQPQVQRLIELVGLHRMDGVRIVAQPV